MDDLRSHTRRLGFSASRANGAMLSAERNTHAKCVSEVGLKPIPASKVELVAQVLAALNAKQITEAQAKDLIRKI